MKRMAKAAAATGLAAAMPVGGCARGNDIRPIYEFQANYGDAVATPSRITQDLDAYAAEICGTAAYETLDTLFVGDLGPSFVRIRFACS
jgi:hypothetical protein